MAWTSTKDWTSGAVTSADMDTYVSANDDYLKDVLDTHGLTSTSSVQHVKTARYGFSAYMTGESCPDSTDKGLPFAESDEEWKDVSSMHSDAAKQSFLAPVTGTYACNGWALFDTNSSGWRAIWIEHAGSTNYNRVRVPAASGSLTGVTTYCELELTAGEAVRLFVRQDSGAALDVNARFQVRLVGE